MAMGDGLPTNCNSWPEQNNFNRMVQARYEGIFAALTTLGERATTLEDEMTQAQTDLAAATAALAAAQAAQEALDATLSACCS